MCGAAVALYVVAVVDEGDAVVDFAVAPVFRYDEVLWCLGLHVGVGGAERHPSHGAVVAQCGHGMLQRGEGAQGAQHLVVVGRPVDFGVGEIVERLVAARFLSVVDERHAVERAGHI